MRTLVVDSEFQGPPNSGQGGYVSGLLARYIDGAAQATLRAPPPIGVELSVEQDGARIRLSKGDIVFAEAEPATLELSVPPPRTFDEAERARNGFGPCLLELGLAHHPAASCFVCGSGLPGRKYLNLTAGPTTDGASIASPWIPEARFADADGEVRPEFVWAVLDFPAGWGILLRNPWVTSLTGRLAARQVRAIRPERRYVLIGWPIGTEGRNRFGGSALYDEDGNVCAYAKATWITLGR